MTHVDYRQFSSIRAVYATITYTICPPLQISLNELCCAEQLTERNYRGG